MALLAQVSTQKLLTRHIQGYGSVDIFDQYTKPGFLTLGAITFNTSSTTDSYTLANNPFVTGSVSTFGLLHTDYDQSFVETGSLYISSLYFGNVGGTVAGQLTTDATATDLFWKGSKLNDQSGGGGGGITTSQLTSTTIGLGTIGYISTAGGGISASEVTSTVVGLGSVGYVSSTQLVSTTESIITAVVDIVNNLGTYGYISSTQLFSTVEGLGQIYSSTMGGGITTVNLTSTVTGLGSSGYVSSLSNVAFISTQQIFTSSIVGNVSQFATLSSQALYVSSLYTATRQATPMFVTF